jgi:hypothetical protein
MNLDSQLIDAIKQNFADYSSAQLQEIADTNDQDRWSAEAVAAARAVLLERTQGQAVEPSVPKAPPPTISPTSDAYNLGFLSSLLVFSPVLSAFLFPRPEFVPEDSVALDQPLPFGSKVAWLAVDTTDTEVVVKALGLRQARSATWQEGLEAAYQGAVFVTAPVADWTLAVGTALFPPDRAEVFVKPLLGRLSRQFGEVQYFATHRDVEMHIWARARKGELLRGYGWLGEKNLTLWNEGTPTREERELGPRIPDESSVMQLACLWSIDPTTLNEQYKEPVLGMLGAWARRDCK